MNAVTDPKATEVVLRRAGKLAAEVHATEAAAKAAEAAKDVTAFEKAIRRNLNAKHDFAAEYRAIYGQGSRSDTSDSTVRSLDFCASFGFIDRTVRRWCETLLSENGLEKAVRARLEAARKRFVDDIQAANFSSAEVEWYTPKKYVEAARAVLGEIDLDPASCLAANQTVRAAQIFTREADALNRAWHGRIFMNPPYGTKDGESVAGMFCMKAIGEYIAGNVEAGVILVNSAHAQKWQAPLYDHPICFVDHRIAFESSDGVVNKAPTFMNIFVYLGEDAKQFSREFSRFGYVMERLRA